MMAIMLRQTPDFFSFKELHFFEEMYSANNDEDSLLSRDDAVNIASRLFCVQSESYLKCKNIYKYHDAAVRLVESIDESELTPPQIYAKFLIQATEEDGKYHPCEQTPRNVYYLSEILRIFPGARFVHMIRDPRAVLSSQRGKWKRRKFAKIKPSWVEVIRSWANYHPIVTTKLWMAANKAADDFPHQDKLHSVKFEDVLDNPEKTLKALCSFLEIPYYINMINIPQTGSSHLPDNFEKKGITTEARSRWKKELPGADIYWAERLAGDYMVRYGYPLLKNKPNTFKLVLSILSLPIKVVMALLLNISRMKNLFKSIRKRIQ